MKKKQIKKLINQVFDNETPFMLEKIKEDCKLVKQVEPIKTELLETKEKKTPSFYRRLVLGGVMACVLALGIAIGNISPEKIVHAKETTIYLDVNPSIEIQIDKNQRIIECIPNNDEAVKILTNISLKGVEIDTALYAIVGSMYVNGYLNTDTNSILVSVDSLKDNESILLDDISKQIDQVFQDNEYMECSIIAQKVNSDELKEKADDLDISVGKMHLVEKLIYSSDLYSSNNLEELAKMSIHELNVIYQSLNEENKSEDVITGTLSGFIDKEQAIVQVLEHINQEITDVINYEIMTIYHYDINNNPHMVYFISMKLKNEFARKYYIVDCLTGEMLSEDIIKDWFEKFYYFGTN